MYRPFRPHVPGGLIRPQTSQTPLAIWKNARQAGLRGMFIQQASDVCLLVELNQKYLDRFTRETFVKEVVRLDQCAFPHFETLKRIRPKARDLSLARVHLDSVRLGHLTGWAHGRFGEPARLEVSIDGVALAHGEANIFREDLLRNGVGIGCHAFLIRPPDRFMDGREHSVRLGVLGESAIIEKSIVIPFHFNLPRPWIHRATVPEIAWSGENEVEYLSIRDEVVHGDYSRGIERARAFVDRFPDLVFRDFGVQERYLQARSRMPSFRSRLDHRAGALFNSKPCHRLGRCCKLLALSYNVARSSILILAPAEVFDTCPLAMRHFADKLMTKAYAQARAVRTARTLGVIASIEEFDGFSFPGRYVMKPTFASGKELYLMHHGINLYSGRYVSKKAIRERMETYLLDQPGASYVVEEFLTQEAGEADAPFVPLDYKLHAFGGKVRLVHIDDRNTVSRDPIHRRQSWLARNWVEAPQRMRLVEQANNPVLMPDCYPEMLSHADAIAAELGGYIRVDMYATDEGPVLGEVSSYSHAGKGFSEFGDVVLSQAWEIFPDRQTYACELEEG